MKEKEGKDEETRVIVTKNMNPSVEHLVAALIDYEQQLCFYREKAELAENRDNLKIIELCERKMAQVKQAIQPDRFWKRKRIFIAWELLHRIGEEMVPLLDKDELSAQIDGMITNIKISSLPETVKGDLQIQLDRARGKLDKDPSNTAHAASVLKNALNVYNNSTDDRFWDIWAKQLNALVYTVLILVFGLVLVRNACLPGNCGGIELGPMTVCTILLLGALGGLTSGIITGEREFLPKGHFWVSTIYYALVRPIMGAVAAVFMFWMIQNHFLVSVEIRPSAATEEQTPVRSKVSATQQKQEQKQAKKESHSSAVSEQDAVERKKETKSDTDFAVTLIRAKVEKGKENYMYAFFLFMAGFLGDKLLKSVADRVSAKLFVEAEKTREVK